MCGCGGAGRVAKPSGRNGTRILRPPRQHTMLQTWPQLHPWMSMRTCSARCAQAARLREAFMEQEKTVRERLSTAKQEAAGQVGSRGGWAGLGRHVAVGLACNAWCCAGLQCRVLLWLMCCVCHMALTRCVPAKLGR